MLTGLWASLELQIYAKPMSYLGIGPDVIVGDIPNIARYDTLNGETSFAIATTSCNIGDERLIWQSNTNIHPVISQNLYRVKDGRIEQLGMSWLKHGFAVAAGNLCGQCIDRSTVYLGVNCSDPYSAGLNGNQSGIGPKSEVNASTGIFVMPYSRLPFPRNLLDGRIRVLNTDLDPALNPGARYFVESQYVHPEDAAAGNGNNNASYREAFASGGGDVVDINVNGSAQTQREKPGILAWQAVHPDVEIFNVDVPNDGRVIVGIRTTPQELGGFHTEVAIENLNSHRSLQSLGIRFCSGSVSNPGFNDIDYQQEPYSGVDWADSINGNEIDWSTETFAENEDANALRWNTIYSFWCDSDTRPSELTLGMFRPGTPSDISIDVSDAGVVDTATVTAGVTSSGSSADICDEDSAIWTLQSETFVAAFSPPPIAVTFEGNTNPVGETDVTLRLVGGPQFGLNSAFIQLRMWNFTTGTYVGMPFISQPDSDNTVYEFTNPVADFVGPNGELRAEITCAKTVDGPIRLRMDPGPIRLRMDQVGWQIQ